MLNLVDRGQLYQYLKYKNSWAKEKKRKRPTWLNTELLIILRGQCTWTNYKDNQEVAREQVH